MLLSEQLEYDRWANHRILDAVAQLDAHQFARELGGSFPSVRDTLVHMAWAEWLWLERWQGHSPRESLDPAALPTLKSVRLYWTEIEDRQARFLESLDEAAGRRRVRYTNARGEEWEYTLSQMVQHLVVHSAYHRGQVATMLRQLGFAVPMTDYLAFVDAKAG